MRSPSPPPSFAPPPDAETTPPAPGTTKWDDPSLTNKYLDTAEAYDRWAAVYDTDNNFLQALDSHQMQESLLPKLASALRSTFPGKKNWKIIDLGCGTGRNTIPLLDLELGEDVEELDVMAVDLSPKMLDLAKSQVGQAVRDKQARGDKVKVNVQFGVYDVTQAASSSLPEGALENADAIISTLVVEHVPLDVFFRATANMLRSGGLLLVTNMHSEMGAKTQAGFVDFETGERIRPRSFAHTIGEVVEAAEREELEVVKDGGEFEEREMLEETWPLFGPRAQKWVGRGKVWYGGILRKKV